MWWNVCCCPRSIQINVTKFRTATERKRSEPFYPSIHSFVRSFDGSFIYYNVFFPILFYSALPQVPIFLIQTRKLGARLRGGFQYTIDIIVLNNVLTPENACRMLIAKRYIKTRMYLAIKWKIYNKACNKYCILYVFQSAFIVVRFGSVWCGVMWCGVDFIEGLDRSRHCLLRKMTMIKTRPTTIATALAPNTQHPAPVHCRNRYTIIQYQS